MPLDPSIPLGIKPPEQTNPFDMIGKYATVSNALEQNKLIQQNTENARLLSQRGQFDLEKAQQDQNYTGNVRAAQALFPLLTMKPGELTMDVAYGVLDRMKDTMRPQSYEMMRQAIAQTGGDDAALRRLVAVSFGGSLGGPEAIKAFTQQPGSNVNLGSQTVATVNAAPLTAGGIAPNANQQTLSGAYQNTPTPGDMATLVEFVDTRKTLPDGKPNPDYGRKQMLPKGQVLERMGGAGTGAPGTPSPLGNGRDMPPALLNPNAPKPAEQPKSQQPGGPMSTSLAPGEERALEASSAHYSAARERANGYQQRIQPIEGALTALGGADTGRASETLNSLRANIQDLTPGFLQSMLPPNLSDPNKRKAYEEAQKYLMQMQTASPGGSRSDAGLAAASAGNPNTHISNAAAIEVTRAILAQHRLEQAGTLLFNKSGRPAHEYDDYMNDWNTKVDPRAFAADKMTPKERADLVKGMGGTSSAAYQKFKKSYTDAVDAGVIPGHGG